MTSRRLSGFDVFLLFFVTFEMVLGGGGRVFVIAEIPLRQMLFLIVLLRTLYLTALGLCIKKSTLYFVFAFVLFILYGVFLSVIIGSSENWMFDVQPLLYFIVVVWLSMLSKEIELLHFFQKILAWSAFFMSITYVMYFVCMTLGVVSSGIAYHTLGSSSEFIFRPDSDGMFFYKGFFFVAIGALFFFHRSNYALFLLCLSAIVLSGSRGVFLSVLICIELLLLLERRYFLASIIAAVGVTALIGMFSFFSARGGESNAVRVADFDFLYENLSLFDFVFGKGFGYLISGRERIEVVYLEMLAKCGIFSVLFFAFIFFLCVKCCRNSNFSVVSIVFVFCVSFTNPFLLTPMGIFLISILLAASAKYKFNRLLFK
ncbi:hypothetical protein NT239_04375 [Chitinibacter sp. SCUT-21]|uniref:hypothetical protein n=1 Tax=Chitinibacter sp. SCUT-21 TaxID=2970891 RepID=UPI0035A58AEA